MVEPGIYRGIPNEEYHRMPGLSRSTLKDIYRETPRRQNEGMQMGTLVDVLFFEGQDAFDELFHVVPQATRRNSKEWNAAVVENPGKEIIKSGMYDDIRWMFDALQNDSLAMEQFQGGESQLSFFVEDVFDEVLVKSRPDYAVRAVRGVDLKTSKSILDRDFRADTARYWYHTQAYMGILCASRLGFPMPEWIIVVVENHVPWRVRTYRLGNDSIRRGRELYRAALAKYKRCRETGFWQEPQTEILLLDIPPGAQTEDWS